MNKAEINKQTYSTLYQRFRLQQSLSILIFSLIFLLVSNAATLSRDKSILFSRNAITVLASASVISISNLHINALSNGVGIYGGLFNVTTFSQTISTFVILMTCVILVLTAFYPRKINTKEVSSLYNILSLKTLYNKDEISNRRGEAYRIIEYPLIILFVLCGAVFLMCTADLISVFFSIELQSYGLYIICTIYRDSESATASGLTYFLLGGLSSCFILLGSALLYANTGTTNLDNIYVITSISEVENFSTVYLHDTYHIQLALIIMTTGFLFKISAAPFHFWSPDVYDGIPTIVTTYVATIAKVSIFSFFLELVYYTDYYFFDFTWKSTLLLSSFFSLIIGSVLGLTQSRIKRLFAYSTISHVGFMLLALCINSVESTQAFIFYILQYTISNLNAFLLLICVGYSFYSYIYNVGNTDKKSKKNKESLVDINNSPVQLISQMKGYFYINSFLAISFAITIFSFVGIPPLIGFFAKQMILSAALDSGYVFMALVAILTSVIGAGYYLNIVKHIFFFTHDYKNNPSMVNEKFTAYIVKQASNEQETDLSNSKKTNFTINNIGINSAITSSVSVITLLLILFILTPDQWFHIVSVLSLMLFKA